MDGAILGRAARAAAWRARFVVAIGVAALAMAGLAATPASASKGSTVWLCRPGLKNNPCTSSETTTVVSDTGATSIEKAKKAARPPIDCFYVYPTVSEQTTVNANLEIEPE